MRVELRTTCKNCSSSSSPCQLEIRDSRPTLVVDQKSRDIALEGRTSPVRVSTHGASWKAFILGSIIQGAPRPECRRMNNCGVRPTAFWGSQAKYIHFKPIARTTNSSRLDRGGTLREPHWDPGMLHGRLTRWDRLDRWLSLENRVGRLHAKHAIQHLLDYNRVHDHGLS